MFWRRPAEQSRVWTLNTFTLEAASAVLYGQARQNSDQVDTSTRASNGWVDWYWWRKKNFTFAYVAPCLVVKAVSIVASIRSDVDGKLCE